MFELDAILERDSVAITESSKVIIRLINDQRYPWVIVVPKASAQEIHDLPHELYRYVFQLVCDLSAGMAVAFNAHKMNVGALGNIVKQLHIHIIVRQQGDAAWPGPVWGVGETIALDAETQAERVSIIQRIAERKT